MGGVSLDNNRSFSIFIRKYKSKEIYMKLALIGLGTVNRGLLELLLEKKDALSKEYDFNPLITAISDPVVGSVFSEKGINIKEILFLLQKENNIKN